MKITTHEQSRHCFSNFQEIQKSDECACFYCRSRFKPSDIKQWASHPLPELPKTAICPNCGIDSVLGDASGLMLTDALLSFMRKEWFGFS